MGTAEPTIAAARSTKRSTGTRRRRRLGRGGVVGEAWQVVKETVEVAASGRPQGPIEPGLEFGLIESAVGKVV